MKILFLHNNFPAQFGGLAAHLARAGWDVAFATQRAGAAQAGISVAIYKPHREPAKDVHPYSATWERAVLSGQGVARVGLALRKKGFVPDIVVAHSGWGPGLYVRDVFPEAKYVGYFEWFYDPPGPDVRFLKEKPMGADERARSRSRNAPILMDFASCDLGICPTEWQKAQFPAHLQPHLLVHHDGVDTDYYSPLDAPQDLEIGDLRLPAGAEIVTYVARGMEPYRGFPQFMAALSLLQKRRPHVHAVIVGEDRVAYGRRLPEGDSFKKRALAELDLDMTRTHFTGYLGREDYRKALRASSVHVYLTVPFVLSWSMMEAMSTGCVLLGSRTAPVLEVLNEENALLADFHDVEDIVTGLGRALSDREGMRSRREKARRTILERYDAAKLLPEKQRIFEALAAGRDVAAALAEDPQASADGPRRRRARPASTAPRKRAAAR